MEPTNDSTKIITYKVLDLLDYCPHCSGTTKQVFLSEDEIFEYYRCEDCQQIHSIAVR